MRIAETFHSIQGEGKLTGVPSFFIRVSGCNLRCHWCDTPYASWRAEGEDVAPEELLEQVRASGCGHVVVTGGEPVIMPGIDELCGLLARDGRHVTLETAGTVFRALPVDLLSLSPKLSSSTPRDDGAGAMRVQHERQRINLGALQRWIDTAAEVQMKFVIQSPRDLEEMQSLLGLLRHWRAEDVLLMPEGTDPVTLQQRSLWLIEACKERGYRFCQRLHVMVWGQKRGV